MLFSTAILAEITASQPKHIKDVLLCSENVIFIPIYIYTRPEVQELLKKLRGFDPNRVFTTSIGMHEEMPRIRLLTTAELNQVCFITIP